jgi:hypothetical protein
VRAAERAVAQGRLRDGVPLDIARQLWAAMHGYVMLDVAGYFHDSGAEHVLIPMFVNLLSGLGADRDAAKSSIGILARTGT